MAPRALSGYSAKRDFNRTPEPAPAVRPSRRRLRFCIQKHAATRLHYDLRLEMDGVMKSWAVPKGPSLDPRDKRLAMHVEDHPLDYRTFEGIIPEGEYGAGQVLLWDGGYWKPEQADFRKGYSEGNLKFSLQGKKLEGSWALVRLKNAGRKENEWLLIKHRDAAARDAADYNVTSQQPQSVKSGLLLEQIGAKNKPRGRKTKTALDELLREAPEESAPDWVPPELATLVKEAPEGEKWIHEIKFDGYRILAFLGQGRAVLYSRNRKNWNKEFPEIAAAIEQLDAEAAVLDGEAVVLDKNGKSSFQLLQAFQKNRRGGELTYQAFDILHLNGRAVRELPLLARKEILQQLLRNNTAPVLRYCGHIAGTGGGFFKKACELGLEGIISKLAESAYRPGRGKDWLKVKCLQRDEFIIGGFNLQQGAKKEVGALHVGNIKDGALIYAGKVGTGFSGSVRRELFRLLEENKRESSPFKQGPRTGIWVEPRFAAQIAYTEMTREGKLRHPSYLGLRDDINPAPRSRVKREPAGKDEKKEEVEGVVLTHPGRVVFSSQGLTKRELASYYAAVWDRMAPYAAGRPLTFVRCPDGEGGECFFQRHAAKSMPAFIPRVSIKGVGKDESYVLVRSLQDVVGLVQMNALELHMWGAQAKTPDCPDLLVMDLDPDEGLPPAEVCQSALLFQALFSEVGLKSFPKITGGKGVHVVVPLSGRHSWEDVKSFAQAAAEYLVSFSPEKHIAKSSKQKRAGKIYVDYLRNARGATSIAAYSVRAKPDAPVAAPVSWKEIKSGIRPDEVTIADLLRGRRRAKDPWEGYFDLRQRLTKEMLKKLLR